jgi:hypothetical protein
VKRLTLVSLVIGVAVGLALPMGVLGIGITHQGCTVGPIIGWSGDLASPWYLALAPPGGFVNYSFWVQWTWSNHSYGFGGYTDVPVNATDSDFDVYNWTLQSERPTQVWGLGPSTPCPKYVLGLVSAGWSCACIVAPPTPGGVGQRLVVPSPFYSGSTPSAVINASYDAGPIGSVTFQPMDGGIEWSNPGNLSGLPVTDGPFYEGGELVGLGFTIRMTTPHFGVPIRFVNGTVEDFTGTLPMNLWPTDPPQSMTYQCEMTYILPLTPTPQAWNIYAAGEGSPYSVGGLLFVQTAGPTA